MAAPGAPLSISNALRAMAVPGAPLSISADHFQEPHLQAGFGRHVREHNSARCVKCIWARNKEDWMRATPVHHIFGQRSWIEVRPVCQRNWTLGCWVCRRASQLNPTASLGHFGNCAVQRPRKSQLIKHHLSARHTRSAHQFLQLRGLGLASDSVAAPAVEEFANLLQRIRRNELETPSGDSRRKSTTMSWL